MSKNPKNRWKYLIWTEKNVVSSERLEELQTQNFRLKLPTAFFLLPSIKCTHVQICWENSYYPLQLGQLSYMLSLAVRKVLQFIISLAIVNIVLKMKRSIFGQWLEIQRQVHTYAMHVLPRVWRRIYIRVHLLIMLTKNISWQSSGSCSWWLWSGNIFHIP